MSRAGQQAGTANNAQGIPFLHAPSDVLLIGLSIVVGVALTRFPSAPAIAVALWSTANTIAHNFKV